MWGGQWDGGDGDDAIYKSRKQLKKKATTYN